MLLVLFLNIGFVSGVKIGYVYNIHATSIEVMWLSDWFKCQQIQLVATVSTLGPEQSGRYFAETPSKVCLKMFLFSFKCHWRTFLSTQLTNMRHWFRYRFVAKAATSHYWNKRCPNHYLIYALSGFNELSLPMSWDYQWRTVHENKWIDMTHYYQTFPVKISPACINDQVKNILAPGKCGCNLRSIIFKPILWIGTSSTCCDWTKPLLS